MKRLHISPAAALRVAFVAKGGLISAWISHLPAISERIGIGHDEVGTALAVISAGYMIAMPAGGALAAVTGARRLLAFGAFAAALLALGPILVGSLSLLFCAMLAFGLASGTATVAGNILGVAVEETSGRRIMSSLYAMHAIGGLLGAGSAAVANSFGIPAGLHVAGYAAAAAVAMCAALRFLPEGGRRATENATGSIAAGIRSPAVLLLGIAAFFIMLAETSTQDWSALHLSRTLGASPATAALGFTAFAAAVTFGCLVGDRVSRAFTTNGFAALCLLIATTGFFIAAFAPSSYVCIAGFALAGLGMANTEPVLLRMVGSIRDVPTASAVATASTIGFSGLVAGPVIIGLVADSFGLAAGIAVPAVVCAVFAVGFAALRRRKSSDAAAAVRP